MEEAQKEKEKKPKAPARQGLPQQKISMDLPHHFFTPLFLPSSTCNYSLLLSTLSQTFLSSAEMANTSSSSAEGIRHQPRTAEQRARYTMMATKNRWEEQGFFFDDILDNYGLEPIIYRRLHELDWFRFAR
ncbi:hypothetical protein V6N13_033765 [Hibiscus sabdariffa]